MPAPERSVQVHGKHELPGEAARDVPSYLRPHSHSRNNMQRRGLDRHTPLTAEELGVKWCIELGGVDSQVLCRGSSVVR